MHGNPQKRTRKTFKGTVENIFRKQNKTGILPSGRSKGDQEVTTGPKDGRKFLRSFRPIRGNQKTNHQ